MERWSDKVALVTGAGSGIGAAIAKQLVKHGLMVVAVDKRVELIQAYEDELADEPGHLYPRRCDVRNEQEIVGTFSWINGKLGGIDVLVNNAGVVHEAPLTEGSTEEWREMLEVNVLGLSICSREAVKYMKLRGTDGHIVNINSIAGHGVPQGFPFMMYLATKHAVTALTEGLRRELTQEQCRIKVTSISPGTIKTDIMYAGQMRSVDPDKVYRKQAYLEPEKIAEGLLYVLGTDPDVQIPELTIQPVGEHF